MLVRLDRAAVNGCDRCGRKRIEDAPEVSAGAVVFSEVDICRADHTAGVTVYVLNVRELTAPRPGGLCDFAFGVRDDDLRILECALLIKGCGETQVVVSRQCLRIRSLPGHDRKQVAPGCGPNLFETPQTTGDTPAGEVGCQRDSPREFGVLR